MDILRIPWTKPKKKEYDRSNPKTDIRDYRQTDQDYTGVEVAILTEFYPKGKATLVAKYLPHRSMHSIRKKAEVLGLASKRPPWTKQQELIVQGLYNRGLNMKEIAQELNRLCGTNRTSGSVNTKLYEIRRRAIATTPRV